MRVYFPVITEGVSSGHETAPVQQVAFVFSGDCAGLSSFFLFADTKVLGGDGVYGVCASVLSQDLGAGA